MRNANWSSSRFFGGSSRPKTRCAAPVSACTSRGGSSKRMGERWCCVFPRGKARSLLLRSPRARKKAMNPRILLIEDEQGLVLTLADLFRAEGYEVDTASDGETGLEKGLSREHSIIVLDVMLPKKNGFEICEELRQAGVDTAILML